MTKREKIYAKYDGKCAYTGKPLGDDWQVDHVKSKISHRWHVYYAARTPNDISRCSNERCEKKLKCKRYLDCLPFETYWYNDFNEKNCNFFIEDEHDKEQGRKVEDRRNR